MTEQGNDRFNVRERKRLDETVKEKSFIDTSMTKKNDGNVMKMKKGEWQKKRATWSTSVRSRDHPRQSPHYLPSNEWHRESPFPTTPRHFTATPSVMHKRRQHTLPPLGAH